MSILLRIKRSIEARRIMHLIDSAQSPRGSKESEQAVAKLVRIGEPAIRDLLNAVREENGGNSVILKILKAVGSPAAVQLIAALADANRRVRWTAAAALEALADPRATAALIQALHDEDPRVRFTAALALGQIRDRCLDRGLVGAINNDERLVGERAAEALKNITIDEQAVAVLLDYLGGIARAEDEDGRLPKGNMLAEMPQLFGRIGAVAIAPLIAALKDELYPRRAKIWVGSALRQITGQAISEQDWGRWEIWWFSQKKNQGCSNGPPPA